MSPLLGLLLGLALLVVGADSFVRGAVTLARRAGLSPHLIGLTLVAWGMALPELAVGVVAASQGLADQGAGGLLLGNVVGANIANALLALGLVAMIFPVQPSREALGREALALGGVALALVVACQLPVIGWPTGAAFLAVLPVHTAYALARERAFPDAAGRTRRQAGAAAPAVHGGPWLAGLAMGGGAIVLAGGGMLVAPGAIATAAAWGIADSVVGLTLVALGTTIPEIVAVSVAAFRRQPDLAIAGLIGSMLFNGLGVVGTGAVVAALAVPPDLGRLDIWAMAGAIGVFALVCRMGWPIDRREGLGLAMAYGLYLLWAYLRAFPTMPVA